MGATITLSTLPECVPFASHELGSSFDWRAHFRDELRRVGQIAKDNGINARKLAIISQNRYS